MNRKKKKVIILGKGVLAIKIANWFLKSPDYKLVLIVPNIPEPTWDKSIIKWAKKHSIPIVKSGHYEDIKKVKEKNWNIDLAFSVYYDKIISQWFISKCGQILNIHSAPLPKYRGVSPINWALKNNETEHGVTIHEIDKGTDTGPIVSQVKFSIYPEFDEVVDVYKRTLEYGWQLFQKTMLILDKIKARPQNNKKATFYERKHDKLLGNRRDFTKDLSLAKWKA